MATITKRSIKLSITYRKQDPGNLTWQAKARVAVADDTKTGGEELFDVATTPQTITRAQFRSITGAQIESTVVTAIDNVIQDLGSGAGSHTINDDFGN